MKKYIKCNMTKRSRQLLDAACKYFEIKDNENSISYNLKFKKNDSALIRVVERLISKLPEEIEKRILLLAGEEL